MIGWRCGNALPVGRVCRGLRVGGWAVAAVFEPPFTDAESLSGAALRLAENLVQATLPVAGAGVRVARVGNSSVRYEIGLVLADQAEAAARRLFVHVYVDRASRRPTPLPAPLRAVVEGWAG